MSDQEAIKIFSQVMKIMSDPGSNISDMRQAVMELAEKGWGIDHIQIRPKPKKNAESGFKQPLVHSDCSCKSSCNRICGNKIQIKEAGTKG